MKNQILIVGLGQFGMSLARTLSEKGAEILAVDIKKELVEEAAAFVTEAVAMDATDEKELAKLEPNKRDVTICAIGDDSAEASIICTALLRQMGSPCVYGRASSQKHYRILKLVGAHEVINPEQEFGRRFAVKLMYRNLIMSSHVDEDFSLVEIHVLPKMVDKTLIELALPKNYGVLVVGIRRPADSKVVQPDPKAPLKADESLIIATKESAFSDLITAYSE